MATSNQKNEKLNQTTIEFSKVEEMLSKGPAQADEIRQQGLTGLAKIKSIKLAQTRRERGRLEAKYGSTDPRVQRLDLQMTAEHQALLFARVEVDKSKVAVPVRDAKKFTLFGHVRDKDGFPLANYNVGLYPQTTSKAKVVKSVVTDDKGYYSLSIPVATTTAEKRTRTPATLYLMVLDEDGKQVYTDPQVITPVGGGVVYKDIVIADASQSGCGKSKTRYLGNSHSRELHDLQNEQPKCQLARVSPDHRVYFASTDEAIQAGYDFCAYCFSKEKSKR